MISSLHAQLDQISALVTPELASQLSKSPEPTLFFEINVLDALELNVSLTRHPSRFCKLQLHFEDLCEDIMSR